MEHPTTISNLASLHAARLALKQRIHAQEVELLERFRNLPKEAAGAAFKAAVPPLLQTAGASLAAKAGLGVAAALLGGRVMKKSGLGGTILQEAGMVAGTQLLSMLFRKWRKK